MGDALDHAHRQGVIHRDIKPANLHQGDDGVLRVLDLGVALTGREPESMRRLHAGTPSYVNPEQWGYSPAGNTVEEELPAPQSDLYALGVTLYQLLTGRLPFNASNQLGLAYAILNTDPPPPSSLRTPCAQGGAPPAPAAPRRRPPPSRYPSSAFALPGRRFSTPCKPRSAARGRSFSALPRWRSTTMC